MAKKPAKKTPAKKLTALTPKKRAPKKAAAKKDLSVYILLDRSGSMQTLWDEALSSINLYATKLDSTTKVVLAAFDSESFDVLRDTTVAKWKDVSRDDAVPRSMTPLYDSAGLGTLLRRTCSLEKHSVRAGSVFCHGRCDDATLGHLRLQYRIWRWRWAARLHRWN